MALVQKPGIALFVAGPRKVILLSIDRLFVNQFQFTS